MMSPTKARLQEQRQARNEGIRETARKVTPLKMVAHKAINGLMYKEDPVTGRWIPS